MIKKIVLLITLICLYLSPVFAQDIIYNRIVETGTKTYAVINDEVYRTGDEVAGFNCIIQDINRDRILLKCDDKQVIVEWIGKNK